MQSFNSSLGIINEDDRKIYKRRHKSFNSSLGIINYIDYSEPLTKGQSFNSSLGIINTMHASEIADEILFQFLIRYYKSARNAIK